MIYKALLVVSLVLFVASIFLPWLSENGRSPLAVYPPIRIVSQFWSYQAVINVLYSSRLVDSFVLRFKEYWFSREFGYLNVFQGWILVFLFQILAVATGAISVVKEKVKGKPLALICTITCSTLSLILCYFQLLRQSAPGRGINYLSVNFDIGFCIALISVILWIVPLWIDKLLRRKIVSLILLLVATGIPTVLFVIGLAAILSFYIRMGGGDLWFDWNRQLIGVTSRGAGTAIYILNFVLGLICIPLFFASTLFLYKEWQNRKKQKVTVC